MTEQCKKTGKGKHDTELDAQLAMVRIQRHLAAHPKMGFREEPTRVYQCEFCGSWHMTSHARKSGTKGIDTSVPN